MYYRRFGLYFILVIFFGACAQVSTISQKKSESMISVIPKPNFLQQLDDSFLLTDKTAIVYNDLSLQPIAEYIAGWIQKRTGFRLSVLTEDLDFKPENAIILALDSTAMANTNEGYRLEINPETIKITAQNNQAIFYGFQTLRQILPFEYKTNSADHSPLWNIPCLVIEDSPRYAWRGMMLDVSRHFFPKAFILEFIDYLAMYKLNTFHWHLVDDQGWRIEIKKYPRLTEIGAWRVDREDRHWNDRPAQEPGEKATYGGYYTQQDIKEIVAYAQSRYVTIVPEIEMPGHTVAALSAYPQYSCSGGPFTVLPGGYWPISDIYCAGNDSTYLFLEDILTEVMELFPGEYIHIGGDEADKTNWKNCPKCQSRIQNEKLSDEHELQSYFIKRMEAFINSKGRKLIGWDEILEGGLAPRATVMSWRGFEGGITAARSGHPVVMTPTSHCYFDYYQGAEDLEPPGIGGYIPLKKVYGFEPTPDSLSTKEKNFILGGQANLWTEYIPDPNHAQYMIFPRISALSEVLWTQKKQKDWDDFARRIEREMLRYEQLGINYAKSSMQVGFYGISDLDKKQFAVELSSELPQLEIRYTSDGTMPTKKSPQYTVPLVIKKDVTIKAAAFNNEEMVSPVFTKSLELHKGIGKKVLLKKPPAEKFSASGEMTLTNGLRGSTNHADGLWLGFEQIDLEAVIDLLEIVPITRVSSSYLNDINSWIFLPQEVQYSVSIDGDKFEQVAIIHNQLDANYTEKAIKEFSADLTGHEARYLKVLAKNIGFCPDWHQGSGGKAWLFCDEIVIIAD